LILMIDMIDDFKKLFWHLMHRVRDLDPQVLLFLIAFYKKGWLNQFLKSAEKNLHDFLNLHDSPLEGIQFDDQKRILLEAVDIFRDNFKQVDKRIAHDI